MSKVKGHRWVKATRVFRGRNARRVQPGETELLHESAARAAVFRGDAVYHTKAETGAPEVGPAIPTKQGKFAYPLRGADKRMFKDRAEVKSKARKKDLLLLLDQLNPQHTFDDDNKKAELMRATELLLDAKGL